MSLQSFSDIECVITISEEVCPSIKLGCDSTPWVSCGPSCECISPSDMTACSACNQAAQGGNDIVPYC